MSEPASCCARVNDGVPHHQVGHKQLTANVANAESDEEPVRMEVPHSACQDPLRWAAGENKNLARLVALYADLPQDAVEEDTKSSMEKELYDLLSKRSPAAASPPLES